MTFGKRSSSSSTFGKRAQYGETLQMKKYPLSMQRSSNSTLQGIKDLPSVQKMSSAVSNVPYVGEAIKEVANFVVNRGVGALVDGVEKVYDEAVAVPKSIFHAITH